MDHEYRDLVGDIIKQNNYDYEKDLPGRGKPLPKDYKSMDTLQHFQKIAKNAGFLPPWIKLRKEIAKLLNSAESDKDITAINNKIKKYNKMCPVQMQRSLVSLSQLEQAKKLWS